MEETERQAQRERFQREVARLQSREKAGTLTPSERIALTQATKVRSKRLAAAEAMRIGEAKGFEKALKNGVAAPSSKGGRGRSAVRGRALPSKITRIVGGGSPGQGKRA